MSQREQTPTYTPECNTAVENLSHWVKDQLKLLANTCKCRLQDKNDVIFWLNSLNQKYAPYACCINVPKYNT